MSVHARSLGSAGRPVFGRPAAAVVAALIAMLAVGAPAALAGETSSPGDPVADVPETTTAPPPAGDPPPVDPPPVDSPPADPPAVDPPPVDPPPVDPPPVDPPPADAPPADPPAVDPPPAQSAPEQPPSGASPASGPPVSGAPPGGSPADGSLAAGSPPSGSPAGGSPAGPAPAQPTPPPAGSSGDGQGNHSVAQNVNRVIQAVWQVQHGCRSYCYGTSQTQRSVQWSETTQSATAVSGESNAGGSSAGATNESSTIQFVWQMQIGCVAFCYATSQSQEASQQSYTTQEAIAESALTAWAENLAETVQYVFQTQQGCEHECHGVTQHQSSTQGQATSQSGTATSGQGDLYGVEIGAFEVPAWLIAYAQNIGATIQTIYQFQEAVCVERCTGDAQIQEAAQRAETDQRAVAKAAAPPAEPSPVAEPPGEEPPGGEPLPVPGPTAPGPAPEGGVYTAPSATGPAPLVRTANVLGRQRRRAVRRQELELRADAPAPGGAPGAPGGPSIAGGPTVSGGPALVPVLGDGVAVTGRTASGDSRETRTAGEQLPARTFAMPSAPSPDGSMSWLAILFLAATLMVLGATLRRGLASNVTQI